MTFRFHLWKRLGADYEYEASSVSDARQMFDHDYEKGAVGNTHELEIEDSGVMLLHCDEKAASVYIPPDMSVNEWRHLVDEAAVNLVNMVVKFEKLPDAEAIDAVYNSSVIKKLGDGCTGLWRESYGYLYDMLCEERGVKNAMMLK